MQEQAAHLSGRFLSLTLGRELFALGIDSVREILDYTEVTRIPQAPPYMRGVVNVRGAAVPVMDLAQKLGLGQVTQTINTRIVIMEVVRDGAVSMVGLLADSVKEVLEIDPAAIAPPPAMSDSADAACLRGIANHEGRFILMLDGNRIFATDATYDLGSMLETAGVDAPAA